MSDLMKLAKLIQIELKDTDSLNVCNDPDQYPDSEGLVFWVQYPFKPTRQKADLGKQYRITIQEDDNG